MSYCIKPVDAWVVNLMAGDRGSVTVEVGDWSLVTLNADGTLTLHNGIDRGNAEGIQVDKGGCIIIQKEK